VEAGRVSRLHGRVVAAAAVVALVLVAAAPLTVRGATNELTLETVPLLAGATLEIGGRQVVTDAEGRARVQVGDVEDGLPTLVVVDDGLSDSNRRAEFSRWWGISGEGAGRVHARAVFDLYDRISWSYHEVDGRPVDPAVVEELVVRSSHGNVHHFTTTEPVWLHSLRVVPTIGGLSPKEIDYRIERVIVDGADVVIRNRQKFIPAIQREWRIEVLFFQVRFTARDAILGFPIEAPLRVEAPSGRVTDHRLGADGELELRLPRGAYRTLVEAPGLQVWTPVALSRDQAVAINVLSYLDIALGSATMAIVALGLLLIGRPHLLARRWPPSGPRARTACAGRCPPAAPAARFCRVCGTRRKRRRFGLSRLSTTDPSLRTADPPLQPTDGGR
jgi:hypothetical protein